MSLRTGKRFEHLFVKMCKSNGYKAKVLGRLGDVDVIANGLRVQCKRLTPQAPNKYGKLRVRVSTGGTGSCEQYALDAVDVFAIWVNGYGLHIIPASSMRTRKGKVAVHQPLSLVSRFKTGRHFVLPRGSSVSHVQDLLFS